MHIHVNIYTNKVDPTKSMLMRKECNPISILKTLRETWSQIFRKKKSMAIGKMCMASRTSKFRQIKDRTLNKTTRTQTKRSMRLKTHHEAVTLACKKFF